MSVHVRVFIVILYFYEVMPSNRLWYYWCGSSEFYCQGVSWSIHNTGLFVTWCFKKFITYNHIFSLVYSFIQWKMSNTVFLYFQQILPLLTEYMLNCFKVIVFGGIFVFVPPFLSSPDRLSVKSLSSTLLSLCLESHTEVISHRNLCILLSYHFLYWFLKYVSLKLLPQFLPLLNYGSQMNSWHTFHSKYQYSDQVERKDMQTLKDRMVILYTALLL